MSSASSSKEASFRSYLDFSLLDDGRLWDDDDSEDNPHLLSGETIVSSCSNVILYLPFTDKRQALLGTVYCTDFKISFVPVTTDALRKRKPFTRRNRLLPGPYDIALACIDCLQVKSTKQDNNFKVLSTSLGVADRLHCLKVFCKDFRVITLDFSAGGGASGKEKELINAVFHYAFPDKVERLFGFTYGPKVCGAIEENPQDIDDKYCTFNKQEDWHQELGRVDRKNRFAGTMWRVSQINSNFTCSITYPECFVLPRSLLDCVVKNVSGNWCLDRFPLWCWADHKGTALFRSSTLFTSSEVSSTVQGSFENAIRESNPRQSAPVYYTAEIPLPDIIASFQDLKKICSTDSVRDFWSSDSQWMSNLGATLWLNNVSLCLGWAKDIADLISFDMLSVIITENEGRERPGSNDGLPSHGYSRYSSDFALVASPDPGRSLNEGRDISAVVSSLVQICLDPDFRTTSGFLSLIQKEWVAFGHPFGARLHGLHSDTATTSNNEQIAPVFLLFLDCTFQLLCQYPSEFEFTQHYLIAIWDMALSGVFKTFILNNIRDHVRYHDLLSARCFKRFFTDDYLGLMINPMYRFKYGLKRAGAAFLRCPNPTTQHPLKLPLVEAVRLDPNSRVPILEFWSDCYLRWASPAQWCLGGNVQANLFSQYQLTMLSDLLRKIYGAHYGVSPVSGGASKPNTNVRLKNIIQCYSVPPAAMAPAGSNVTSGLPYIEDVMGRDNVHIQQAKSWENECYPSD